MKKSIVIAILFVMLVCVATTFANATTSSELAEKLYNNGDWITIEDYFGLSSSY